MEYTNVNEQYRHSTYRDSTTTNQTIVQLNQTKASYVREYLLCIYCIQMSVMDVIAIISSCLLSLYFGKLAVSKVRLKYLKYVQSVS